MRSLIVGTAGHIDHGKSALVWALTGSDPDRLKEEKERGITIDLGFAHLALGDGLVASFVDVPGHERFVRQMLAGAHGIDVVLLVVAADESVMPQTREHFHICRLLGIARGIVALTKCDVADAELAAVAESEVRALTAGSFLGEAPIVRVSARTGEGLEALKDALRRAAREVDVRSTEGVPRLPVDRVFTLRGFGTVVTGTLVSGALAVGDEIEILPAGQRARVRGLEIHGERVDRAVAGHRVAVNLAGIEVDDVVRGDVVAWPGTLTATSMADVELSMLADARPLARRARVRVHVGSAEVLARVEPLVGEAIAPGAAASAQLRLERPVVLAFGDRLILRAYSPPTTIGGGRVVDPQPLRLRRSDPRAAVRFARLAQADALGAAQAYVEGAGVRGVEARSLAARVAQPMGALVARLRATGHVWVVEREPALCVAEDVRVALRAQVIAAVGQYHHEQPRRPAIPIDELRRSAFGRVPEAIAQAIVSELARDGRVVVAGEGLSLAGHQPAFSERDLQLREWVLSAARGAGFAGVTTAQLAEASGRAERDVADIVRALLAAEQLRRLNANTWVDAGAIEALLVTLRGRFAPGDAVDVAVFKELTGLTRKHAIPLLELLDGLHATRRTGAQRLWRG